MVLLAMLVLIALVMKGTTTPLSIFGGNESALPPVNIGNQSRLPFFAVIPPSDPEGVHYNYWGLDWRIYHYGASSGGGGTGEGKSYFEIDTNQPAAFYALGKQRNAQQGVYITSSYSSVFIAWDDLDPFTFKKVRFNGRFLHGYPLPEVYQATTTSPDVLLQPEPSTGELGTFVESAVPSATVYYGDVRFAEVDFEKVYLPNVLPWVEWELWNRDAYRASIGLPPVGENQASPYYWIIRANTGEVWKGSSSIPVSSMLHVRVPDGGSFAGVISSIEATKYDGSVVSFKPENTATTSTTLASDVLVANTAEELAPVIESDTPLVPQTSADAAPSVINPSLPPSSGVLRQTGGYSSFAIIALVLLALFILWVLFKKK